jgi:PEGA domain
MKMKIRFLINSSFALGLAMFSACTPPPPTANSSQPNKNAGAQANSNAAQSQTSQTARTSQQSGGTIEVKSNPSGATIFLVSIGEDDAGAPQQYGFTPATINVPPGKYLVNLEVSGYRAFQKQVNVAQGKSVQVNATLKKR